MKIHQDINHPLGIKAPVVTTGTFDGVHRGHQQILARINEVAREIGGESVLFSFHPHPRTVLYPDDHGLRLLQTRSEKHDALRKAGIDHLIEIPFTREFAAIGAKDYVDSVLVEAIGVRKMVIGYDHRFGKSREGDINTLRILGAEKGFEVEEIPAYLVDALKVSSTKVRNALLEGDVASAAIGLGRPYALKGKVVEGKQLGRTIGFPTANLHVEDELKLIPANGVYAVRANVNGSESNAMMNIGLRPTLNSCGSDLSLEVHLFGHDEDLYGSELRIEFIKWIRAEQRFENLESLKEQLLLDREHAMRLL